MGHSARRERKRREQVKHDEVEIYDRETHLRVTIADHLRIHHSESPGSMTGFEVTNREPRVNIDANE